MPCQEERASWLERFLAYVKETWTSLEETEIQMNFVHITVRTVRICGFLLHACPVRNLWPISSEHVWRQAQQSALSVTDSLRTCR